MTRRGEPGRDRGVFQIDDPSDLDYPTLPMTDPTTANVWCEALDIAPPKLADVAGHPEANTFALLLVALLERGEAMTLVEVAAHFEEAGIAERSRALLSLQRCKPGRPPIYREGERYHLDPHEAELGRWVFRLGLTRPSVEEYPRTEVEGAPQPDLDASLTADELDEAWKDTDLQSWSAQRLVLAVLDADGGPSTPAEIVAAVATRTKWFRLNEDAAKFMRRSSAVEVLADGRWAIRAGSEASVKQTRQAVRDRVAAARRHAATRIDPALFEQQRVARERERAEQRAELAKLTRALLVAFPPARPEAVALLDVGEHTITTLLGDELAALPSRLAGYDVLGGIDVRGLLRVLGVDAGKHRLAELGPAQKSKSLNRSGRTLKITTEMLVQGSCGIGKPFGDPKKLTEYLAKGEQTKLRRRLEADVKSLYALYEYGRLHGVVRLRWGFLDEPLPAPWAQGDEETLYELKQSAITTNVPLEVVLRSAPGWDEPWARVRLAYVAVDERGWRMWLVDQEGLPIDEAEVQRARLPAAPR